MDQHFSNILLVKFYTKFLRNETLSEKNHKTHNAMNFKNLIHEVTSKVWYHIFIFSGNQFHINGNPTHLLHFSLINLLRKSYGEPNSNCHVQMKYKVFSLCLLYGHHCFIIFIKLKFAQLLMNYLSFHFDQIHPTLMIPDHL